MRRRTRAARESRAESRAGSPPVVGGPLLTTRKVTAKIDFTLTYSHLPVVGPPACNHQLQLKVGDHFFAGLGPQEAIGFAWVHLHFPKDGVEGSEIVHDNGFISVGDYHTLCTEQTAEVPVGDCMGRPFQNLIQ